MKISNPSTVPVYTVAGPNTARPLPDWLIRKRKRSLKDDPEFTRRVELLQDFEFEEAGCCVRASEDGEWLLSTGTYKPQVGLIQYEKDFKLRAPLLMAYADTCALPSTPLNVLRPAHQ